MDLSSFLLTDSDRLPRYAFGGTLEPGGWRIVFGSDSYAWEKAQGYPAYGLSLGNSGDTVMLWQVAGAETLLVDSYVYKSHEAAADRSAGRRVDGGEWALFDGLDPYSGTTPPLATGCVPSPGATQPVRRHPGADADLGEDQEPVRALTAGWGGGPTAAPDAAGMPLPAALTVGRPRPYSPPSPLTCGSGGTGRRTRFRV